MEVNKIGLGKVLLIIDDDEDLREILSFEFESLGFKTLCVSNGFDAIKLLETNGVDAILSDIQMPILDGIALKKMINDMGKESLKFFFMTGFSSIPNKELFDLGACDILNKPFNRNQIKEIALKASA